MKSMKSKDMKMGKVYIDGEEFGEVANFEVNIERDCLHKSERDDAEVYAISKSALFF